MSDNNMPRKQNATYDRAPITDRIRYLIGLSRLSQAKFAQRLGMDPANLSKVLSGALKMSDVFLNRVVVELGVSKRWLTTGEGVPYEKNAEATLPVVESHAGLSRVRNNGVPVYDIDVTAGFSELSHMFTQENIIGFMNLPKLDSSCVMVRVSGNSMVPVIDDGGMIAIHPVQRTDIINWGQIYVVILEDYRVVKYIRRHQNPDKVILRSANPDYDDMEIDRADILGLYAVEAVVNCRVL